MEMIIIITLYFIIYNDRTLCNIFFNDKGGKCSES